MSEGGGLFRGRPFPNFSPSFPRATPSAALFLRVTPSDEGTKLRRCRPQKTLSPEIIWRAALQIRLHRVLCVHGCPVLWP